MNIFKSKLFQAVTIATVAVVSFMTVWSLTGMRISKDSSDPYQNKNIRKN